MKIFFVLALDMSRVDISTTRTTHSPSNSTCNSPVTSGVPRPSNLQPGPAWTGKNPFAQKLPQNV